jgi:hypothetical protein
MAGFKEGRALRHRAVWSALSFQLFTLLLCRSLPHGSFIQAAGILGSRPGISICLKVNPKQQNTRLEKMSAPVPVEELKKLDSA